MIDCAALGFEVLGSRLRLEVEVVVGLVECPLSVEGNHVAQQQSRSMNLSYQSLLSGFVLKFGYIFSSETTG